MSTAPYALPQARLTITHSAVDYDFSSKFTNLDLTLRENAVNTLKFTIDDIYSENFLDRCDITDNVKLEFRFQDKTSAYRQMFGGWITELQPQKPSEETLEVTALGYEQGLVNMLVQQQYGTQSLHSGLNTITEVLTDSTYGILPKYVEKLLASATSSGYTVNTTKIAALTSDYRYLYFTGKPASRCLEDLIQLISAANAPSAGAHWIGAYSGTTLYLCIATVGNHENPPADVWPTYWNSTVAASTIEVNKDMIGSFFRKKRSDGNYIYLVGDFRRPSDSDKWTENNSGSWGDVYDTVSISDNGTSGYYKIGSYSIQGRIPTSGQSGIMYYPTTGMAMNFNQIGTKTVIPHLGFYIRVNENTWRGGIDYNGPSILCGTNDPVNTHFYQIALEGVSVSFIPRANEWYHVSVPVGPYANYDETFSGEWTANNSPSWADIDYIGFLWYAGANNADLYVDGFGIHGRIVRAACDSSKYSAQKCKMKFIRDDVPKDDSLTSDDSGEMAQYAKAELYRAMQTPILGQIIIPMQESMMAGQLCHIHYCKKADATFRIDKDMRITEVTHHFDRSKGAISLVNLTDDVTNSVAVGLIDAYKALVQATEPNFRDRATASLVSGDLDPEMTVFAKDYAP